MKVLVIASILFIASSARAQFWQKVFGPTGGDVEAIAADAEHVYAGTDSGVYMSTNNGETWTQELAGLGDSEILSIAVTPSGAVLAGAAGEGIFRSTNFGSTWDSVNSGLPANSTILCLAGDGHGNIYAGHSTQGVYYSSDDGRTWIPRNSGIEDQAIYSLTIAPNGTIYAGSNLIIFSSPDMGEHWDTSYNIFIQGDEVLALAADSSDNVFAGTLRGQRFRLLTGSPGWGSITPVAVSSEEQVRTIATVDGRVFLGMFGAGFEESGDLGSTWSDFSGGLTDASVNSLTVAPTGYLFTGTFLADVFRFDLQLAVTQNANAQSSPTLWPQPFSDKARVSFQLSQSEPVRVTVSDELGRTLQNIEAGTLDTGPHTLGIDASSLPNGPLFIHIATPSHAWSVAGFCLH